MKKHFVVSLIAVCLLLSACHANDYETEQTNPSADGSQEASGTTLSVDDTQEISDTDPSADDTAESSEIAYSSMIADWPVYTGAEELVGAADAVFLGKVTEISFAVLDIRNGMPVSASTDIGHRSLYTLYALDIQTVYKGNVAGRTHFKVDGGLEGYQEERQVELLRSNGLISQEKIIPLMMAADGDVMDVQVGKTYLFVMKESSNEALFNIVNMDQTAFELDSPTQAVTGAGGNISPQDVISAFGEEKWEEFHQRWSQNAYS